VTLPPTGHHVRATTFNLSLCYYERKYERKKDKKANNGLGKSALRMKVPHTLYKGSHE
jgi:hypothetical protein